MNRVEFKSIVKKRIALLLSVLMVIGLVPASAFATESTVKNVVGIDTGSLASSVDVPYGTSREALNLPDQLTVEVEATDTEAQATKESAKVTWKGDYSPEQAGEYKLSAAFAASEYEYKGDMPTVVIRVAEPPKAEPQSTEPEQTPAEPEQEPAEEPPAAPEQTPADPEKTPAEPAKAPAEPEKAPAEPEKAPAEPAKAPAAPEQTPDEENPEAGIALADAGDPTLINLIDINAITAAKFEVKPQGASNFIPVPVPDGTIIHVGDEVHIEFKYTTLNDVVSNNIYYFDIPEGLSAITGESRGDIKDGATVIGSYWVEGGKVKLQFTNEQYLDETGNEITEGFVNFYATLNQDAVNNKGEITLGNTVIGTVPIVPDEDITNVNLTKWNGDGTDDGSQLVYDPNRNAVQYTFQIDTNGNNKKIDTISVKDTLTTTVNDVPDTSIVTGNYTDITITPSGAATFTKGGDGNYVLTASNVAPDTTIKVSYWVPVKAGIVQAKFINDVEATKTVGGTTTNAANDSVQGNISNSLQINKRNAAPVFDPDTATTTVTYTVTVTAPKTNTTAIPNAYVFDEFTIHGEFVKKIEKVSGDGTFGSLDSSGTAPHFEVQLGNMNPGDVKTYTYKATLDSNLCYFCNTPGDNWFDNWATAKSGDLSFDKSKASINFKKQFTQKTGTYDPISGKYRFILTFDGTIPGTDNQYYNNVLKSFADEITSNNATYSGTPAPKLEAMTGNTVVKSADLDGSKIDGKKTFDLQVPTDMQGAYSYRLTYYVNMPAGSVQVDTVKNKFVATAGIGPGGTDITFESTSSVSSGSATSNSFSKFVDVEGGTKGIPGNNEFGTTKFSLRIYSPVAADATLTDWTEKTSGAMVDFKMPLDFIKQNMTIKFGDNDLVEGTDYKIESVGDTDEKFMITFLHAFPDVTEQKPIAIDYLAQVVASDAGKEMAQNPDGGKIGNQKEVYNYAQLNNGGLTIDKKAKVDLGGWIEKKAVNKAGMDVANDLIGWDIVITNGYFDAFATGFHPLVDSIPSNQELVKIEQFIDNRTPATCSTDPTAEHGYEAVVNGDGSTTVTINAFTGLRNHPQTYRIWTRIKDSELIKNNIDPDNFDDVQFSNSAYYETVGTKWNVSADTTVTRHNNDKTFKYNAATEGQGGIEFTMTINAEGLDMDALKDTITIHDTMNRALTLKKETLRLNGKTIDQVPGATLIYTEGSNQFTLELPDETPFEITYIAEIDAEVGEAGWLSNEAYVEGRYGTVSTEQLETERLDVSAGSSSVLTFYLKKTDAKGKLLSNGKFEFRKVTLNGGNLVETPVITASNKDSLFFDFKDGTYKFRGVEKGVIYALEEVGAPDGCEPDNIVHYVYFGEPNAAVKAALENAGKTVVKGRTGGASAMDTMFTLVNTDTVINIKVTKVWEDGDDAAGTRPDSVTVTLKADGAVKETKTITKDAQGKWEATFTGLPTHKTNDDTTRSEIEYTLEETDVNGYTKEITGSAENGFTVTNTREAPSPAQVVFNGTKTLTEGGQNKTITAGQFSFVMVADPSNPAGAELPQTTTANVAADGTFSFDAVSFSRVGTYKFNFKETQGTATGYSYDGSTVTATVKVTLDADNKLVVGTPTYTKGGAGAQGISFANTYTPESVDVKIPVEKLLNGDERPEDTSFHFTLTAKDNAPLPDETAIDITVAKDKGSTGAGEYGPITFTKAGTYEYVITERNDNKHGFTYDTTKTVTIVITDNDGVLTADWPTVDTDGGDEGGGLDIESLDDGIALAADLGGGDKKVTFINTYQPDPTTLEVPVKKAVTGNARPNDTTFTFTLTGANGAPVPANNSITITVGKNVGATATAKFDAITFTKAGTYTYTVAETNDGQAGFTYAPDQSITVKVTDVDGRLNAVWTITGGAAANELTFTNTYSPAGASVSIPVVKNITGNARPNDTVFHFTLAAKNNAPMPANAEIDVTVAANEGANGNGTFGPIAFDQVGTYEYTITERNDGANGFSYAGPQTVKVAVTDNNGTLVAKWTVGDGTEQPDAVTFVNNYKPAETTLQIPVRKTVEGNVRPNDATFTFTLDKNGDAPVPQNKVVTITVGTGKNATATAKFDAITFTKAGTYTYTVTETNDGKPGFAYAAPQTVTVTVNDNNGALEAAWEVPGSTAAEVPFVNTYTPTPVQVTVPVTKNITGNARPGVSRFRFTISGANNAPMPGTTEIDIPVPSAANSSGFGSFGPITFTEFGIYEYTITERADGKPGFTYDTPHKVAFDVHDNGGRLEATLTIDDGRDANASAVFTNHYEPGSVSLTIPVEKIVDGNERPTTKTFTFELKENGQVLGTKTITDQGEVSFSAIKYTEVGTHTYTVSEVAGTEHGYTYSTEIHTVVATITDDNGQLVLDWTLDGAAADGDTKVAFTNTYTPDKATINLPVSKKITGSKRPEDTSFRFTIAGLDNAPMPADSAIDISVAAAAGSEGASSFGPIEFSKAGTYQYVITERNDNKHGFTYDTEHSVTVKVTDVEGVLGAVWTVEQDQTEGADVVFTNNYVPDPVFVELPVVKEITGNPRPAETTFTFTLTDAFGIPFIPDIEITVGASAGDNGTASFAPIGFTDAGTYTFTITETDDGQPGFTYDAPHTVTVVVTDTDGVLSATWTVDQNQTADADVVFTNNYTPAPVSISIPLEKQLLGNQRPEDTTFHFTLTGDDASPLPAETEKDVLVTKNVGDTGSTAFGEITFDAAGTYTYTITEQDDGKHGFTYDTEHTVTVVVTDTNGALSAVWTVDQDQTENADVVFTNNYVPDPVAVDLPVVKEITGNARPSETTFHFTLTADENTPLPAETDLDITVGASAGDTGSGAFGSISFTQAGTYFYTITEHNDGANGFTYDGTHTATVVVTDTDGVLSAVWTVDDGEAANADIVFTNAYQPSSVLLAIPVEKLILGDARTGKETFSFQLAQGDRVLDTREIEDQGTATFNSIEFTQAGTYLFTVREVAGNAKGYTYDTTVHEIVVTVTDRDGVLETSWTDNDKPGQIVTFENTFKADPEKPGSDKPSSGKTGGKSPKTNDDSSPIFWACLLMVSFGGVLGTSVYSRKKKKQGK